MLDKKLRIEASGTEIELNSISQSYTELFSYSGEGQLFNFALNFDSDNILCKLEIDNDTIFDVNCSILDQLFNNGGSDDKIFNIGINWDTSQNRLLFTSTGIEFSTNFKISAKANSGSSSRDLEEYIVTYTVDDDWENE